MSKLYRYKKASKRITFEENDVGIRILAPHTCIDLTQEEIAVLMVWFIWRDDSHLNSDIIAP